MLTSNAGDVVVDNCGEEARLFVVEVKVGAETA
jgi:hypothetical protein